VATHRPDVPTFARPDLARLVGLDPDTRRLPAGTRLWRIYSRAGRYPTRWSAFRYFGPSDKSRFDHHEAPARLQQRGILYAAPDIPVCIAEVFQRDRTIDRQAGEPWLVAFETQHELQLLDLTGQWPIRAGASQEINDGIREIARAWSRAIYATYPDLAGLWYRSKMHGGTAVALYERSSEALPAAPVFHEALASQRLFDSLRAVAHDIGYDLV
jgi:hypothetical protein